MGRLFLHDKTYHFSMQTKRFDCLSASIFQIVFLKIKENNNSYLYKSSITYYFNLFLSKKIFWHDNCYIYHKLLWEEIMKRILQYTVLGILILCTITLLQPRDSFAKEVEVRFSAYYPEHYPVFKFGWKTWEEMVTKESNGEFTFRNFLNGVLHPANQGFRAVASGVCDLTTGYPSYAAKSFHLSKVNDLPFLFPNTYVGPLVMETLYPKYFKKEYEKMGVYLGAWVNVSQYHLISKKPVRCMADLKGMKIRSVGGLCSDFLEALGAVPVMMQSAESYTGLQSGVIDGVLYADGSAAAYKLYEIAKYSTRLGIMNMGVPYCMNKAFFKGLTPEQQKFFYLKMRQASQIASQSYDIDDKIAAKTMKENGVEFIEISPEEKAKMRKAVQPVYDQFIADCEAEGYPAKAMFEELTKLTEQYKDLSPEQALELVTKNPVKGIITGF